MTIAQFFQRVVGPRFADSLRPGVAGRGLRQFMRRDSLPPISWRPRNLLHEAGFYLASFQSISTHEERRRTHFSAIKISSYTFALRGLNQPEAADLVGQTFKTAVEARAADPVPQRVGRGHQRHGDIRIPLVGHRGDRLRRAGPDRGQAEPPAAWPSAASGTCCGPCGPSRFTARESAPGYAGAARVSRPGGRRLRGSGASRRGDHPRPGRRSKPAGVSGARKGRGPGRPAAGVARSSMSPTSPRPDPAAWPTR